METESNSEFKLPTWLGEAQAKDCEDLCEVLSQLWGEVTLAGWDNKGNY